MNMIHRYKKCKTCPYALGYIKCIISPCKQCILEKRKNHPFTGLIAEKKSADSNK